MKNNELEATERREEAGELVLCTAPETPGNENLDFMFPA